MCRTHTLTIATHGARFIHQVSPPTGESSQLHQQPGGANMRQDRIQVGDTLQSIAIRNYYVYDDQGKLDEDRIKSVAGELIKWNTNLLQFPPRDQSDLLQARWLQPSVPGVAAPGVVPPAGRDRIAQFRSWIQQLRRPAAPSAQVPPTVVADSAPP